MGGVYVQTVDEESKNKVIINKSGRKLSLGHID